MIANSNPPLHAPDTVLYLVPVPLSDDTKPCDVLPLSVLDIVKELKCFFVENIRSARRFLKSIDRDFNIDSAEMYILDEHTRLTETPALIETLMHAGKAAIISEAGCPSVADPGALMVELARDNGVRIIPLTGPSSILLGLMASGFNGQNFAFNGYLPHDNIQRKRKIKELVRKIAAENQTQIFIETPYRNNRLIAELCEELPPEMRMCVGCELTSSRETIIVKTISQWKRIKYDFSKKPSIFLLSR